MDFCQSISTLITCVISVAGVVLIAVFGMLLKDAVYREQIRIEPISVPNTLAAEGYTPVVVAQRIRDALVRIKQEAATAMQMPETDLPGETPEVVVPAVGISVETLAAALRRYVGIGRLHEVTGEIVATPDGMMLMRVRLGSDRNLILDSASEGVPRDLNDLIETAAVRILDETAPYIRAAREYHLDRQRAYQMAEDIIRRRPPGDRNALWALSLEGSILLDQGQLEAAKQKYLEALQIDATFVVGHVNLGLVLDDEQKREDAASNDRAANQREPKYVIADYFTGLVLRAGNRGDAIAQYRIAIQLAPEYAVIHNNLGVALSEDGLREEAASEYRIAFTLDPTDAQAHNNLGLVLRGEGKRDEAASEFRAAFTLDPNYAAPHFNLGLVLRDEGKPEGAASEFRTAFNLDPNYAAAHFNLGLVFVDEGKPDEAANEFRTAFKINPTFVAAHSNLGLILRDEGKRDEAAREFRAAFTLNPNDAADHNNLGLVLGDEGKRDEAASEYRIALKLDPNLAAAHFNLGLLLMAQAQAETDRSTAARYLSEACGYIRAAARLTPAAQVYPKVMQQIDALLAGSGHCPPR